MGQELFFEVVASDKRMRLRDKVYWLLECCRQYWAIREAAVRVYHCYKSIETRHETMPHAIAALESVLFPTIREE